MTSRKMAAGICASCAVPFQSVSHNTKFCSMRCALVSRIDRSGDPDGCWPWMGYRDPVNGYGRLHHAGVKGLAHRLFFTLLTGPIPNDLLVCHTCDNPPCMNPRHLWLGTIADNNADKMAKGREYRARGDDHVQVKLTSEIVSAIRASTEPNVMLAVHYGVTRQHIRGIRIRKTWRHLP